MLAKIGADTAENERNFVENLPKIGNYPTGPLPSSPAGRPELRGVVAAELRGDAALRGVPQNDGPRRCSLFVLASGHFFSEDISVTLTCIPLSRLLPTSGSKTNAKI